MTRAAHTYDPLPRFVLTPPEPVRLTADDLAELLRDEAEADIDAAPVIAGGQGRAACELAVATPVACGLFLILGVLICIGLHAAF